MRCCSRTARAETRGRSRIDWPSRAERDASRHNHNMVWSPDNTWIYFVHGTVRDLNHQTNEMDIWRVPPSGGSPERLTYLNANVTFLAMLDQDTLVFIAPGRMGSDPGSGPWMSGGSERRASGGG